MKPFKPGMTASVEIITQVKDDIFIVPISSVTTRNKKDSLDKDIIKQIIFVQDDDKVRELEVETGISDFENIEILSNLDETDNIVSGPYIAISKDLKDGTKIEIKEKKKPNKSIDEDQKKSEVNATVN